MLQLPNVTTLQCCHRRRYHKFLRVLGLLLMGGAFFAIDSTSSWWTDTEIFPSVSLRRLASHRNRNLQNRRNLFNLAQFSSPKTVHQVTRDWANYGGTDAVAADSNKPCRRLGDERITKIYSRRRKHLYKPRKKIKDDGACMHFECDWDLERCAPPAASTATDMANAPPVVVLEDYYRPDATLPPCCNDILRRMNRAFDEEMCDLGLGASGSAGDYVAGFGLLLGIVRHDDVIPWSNDVDVMVLETTMAAMLELWDARRSGMSIMHDALYRMCVNENFLGGRLRRWEIVDPKRRKEKQARPFAWRGYPYLDMYVGTRKYKGDADNRDDAARDDALRPYFSFQPRCCVPYDDVWPSSRVVVGAGRYGMNVPAWPLEVLNGLYGPNWATPDADHNAHGAAGGVCKRVVCKDMLSKGIITK